MTLDGAQVNPAIELIQTIERLEVTTADFEFVDAVHKNFGAVASQYAAQGVPESDIEILRGVVAGYMASVMAAPGFQLRQTLEAALVTDATPLEVQEADEVPGEPPPAFPTGVYEIDHRVGGLYGMACVAGPPKVGKSYFAVATAIEAAMQGWHVVYLNGELTRTEVANRVIGYAGYPTPEVLDRLKFLNVRTGVSVERAIRAVQPMIPIECPRFLLVIDSINRLVSMQGGEYFDALHEWSELPRRLALYSEGRLACLVVSEVNAQGAVKGRQLEYAANIVVRLSPVKDDDGSERVHIEVPLARSSPGGEMGEYELDHARGRFRRYE